MSKTHIPQALRKKLSQEGRHRCGYCLTPQKIIGLPMAIDHIFPESKGGKTEQENLWLACRRCNEFKGSQVQAIDSLTDKLAPLFNPRRQSWQAHFAWSEDGTCIIGLTSTGRATVEALRLNNDEIIAARSLWVQVGWHPPIN